MMKKLWVVISEKEVLRLGARLHVTLQQLRMPDGHEVRGLRAPASAPPRGNRRRNRERQHPVRTPVQTWFRPVILTLPAGGMEPGISADAASANCWKRQVSQRRLVKLVRGVT